MNLDEKIINALKDLDYKEATEIQKKAIPVALKKRDILAAAQSGTGKTAAFLLPILTELLANKQANKPILRALILVPTRELATQISISSGWKYNMKSLTYYQHASIKPNDTGGYVDIEEKTYNEIEERMEALLAKGTQFGGMDFLSEVEKEELKVLSEAAYDWECEVDPHPWRVKPSLIAAIKVAFRQKGYKQKEAAKAIGVSTTALSDILHGRRAINFDVARNIYHNLGVPANVVLG